ncbi:MupA/Atu3671 family FMN-dependent luciferase-like monooxygenase [Pontibaca methylaminivorans]|uniref:MupA/Atu3671 family FMN-dependent luciferase-like monooxygenase n=1 Tax=Pontibaca methylaminivorans TaxID=515897 RepID=UPI002FDB2641
MTAFSCVLIGEESLVAGCGDMLRDRGHVIAAVVSADAGVHDWAQAQGITIHRDMQGLAGATFDWLFSIANLKVIARPVLDLAGKGAINFHDGPLPDYSGLNTPVWALVNGRGQHGVTWHVIERGIDEGDILAERRFDIAADETAFSLNTKCYAQGLESFADVLAQLESGRLDRRPQDPALPREIFTRDRRPEAAGILDFTRPAGTVSRLVRALDFGGYWNPLVRAKIVTGAGVVLIGTAEQVEGSGTPGTIVALDKESLTVACADGALRLGGLTDSAGQPLRPRDIAREGETLKSPDRAERAAIDALIQRLLGAEPFWREALAQAHPVELPLAARDAGAPDWQRHPVALGAEPAKALALIGALALRSAGEMVADLALRDGRLAADAAAHPGLVAPWVPLRIEGAETLSDTAIRAARTLDMLAGHGGYAADLIARDPAIAAPMMPAIGISLDLNEPIAGTALTFTITNGQVALLRDRNRLDDAGLALLEERLQVLAGAPDGPIADIDIIPPHERDLILDAWNRTRVPYDEALTLHHAFEAEVARHPDAPALVYEDSTLTYGELNARANAVAAQLIAAGVGRGDHVGIYLPRGPELLIGTMAILKAGGAYVPLDPTYPAERLAHYVSDSEASVILTDASLRASLPANTATIVEITPDTRAENVDGGAGPADLAYVIYTSGSTGTPKGVMVEHRNVSNFFTGMDAHIDHAAGGVWLSVTSLSFDISVLELFWTLARGFKIVLLGDENRAAVSGSSRPVLKRHLDFSLFYWGNDDGVGREKYRLLLDGARFADENGFCAIWTPERHFHAFGGPYPNPSITGAAVAAVTRNLEVRAGSCVAPLHHPIRIAEEWAVIDNLTNGRTGLAIASGWHPEDFVLRPENSPPKNKPAMYETIEMLRRMWRGEKVPFPMGGGKMVDVLTQPRPVSNELKIWVTTAGNPETWRDAGRIGANVLTHLLGQTIEEVGEKIKIYHQALRDSGHDPKDHNVTLMLHSYLAKDRETAREVARQPMKDYLAAATALVKQYAWTFPAFKKPRGVDNPMDIDLDSLDESEVDAILDFAFERYFEDSGLFGTVDDALARAEHLKRIGVDEIGCLIDFGIAPDRVLEGLKPLAEALRRTNAPSDLAAEDFSLTAQILRHGATHLQCTPSLARMITQNDEASLAVSQLRQMLIGGEGLPGELVEAVKRCTDARILNMYGPTETAIWSTVHPVDEAAPGIQPIGRPIANTVIRVLDETGRPCPVGVAGELFIGGAGVVRGYWKRPDLTAERFVPDPFDPGERIYQTGDLVRWQSDGSLAYLGRTDHQVKIRGQRIELGEIETVLADFPGVESAVVIARELVAGDPRLLGYYTAAHDLPEADLRHHLGAALPEVMIPTHLVRLDSFPLTPNKKIDRNALPDPVQRGAQGTDPAARGEAPSGGTQARIASIWARILGVEDIRAEDNFFQLGGHSLLAVQAHREIRAELDLPSLSITDIFRFPTLAALASHVGGDEIVPPPPANDPETRAETMSRRRAMRAGRERKTG